MHVDVHLTNAYTYLQAVSTYNVCKGKGLPITCHEGTEDNRGTASLFPNLSDGRKCVVKAKLRPFYTPGNNPDTLSTLIPNLSDGRKCVVKAKLRPFYTPGSNPDTLSTGDRVCLSGRARNVIRV
jgi:hypothetical protein